MLLHLEPIKLHPSVAFKPARRVRCHCKADTNKPTSQPTCEQTQTGRTGARQRLCVRKGLRWSGYSHRLFTGRNEALPAQAGNRRQFLTKAGALLLVQLVGQAAPVDADVPYDPPTIRPHLAPKQGTFDPTDEDLREAAGLLQRALNAEEVQVWPCEFVPYT